MDMRPVRAEIDLKAIENNIRLLKSLVPDTALFMTVVKADGYGHGAVEVSNAALRAGSDRLGVAMVEEALELRQAGILGPVHILSEVPPIAQQIDQAVKNGFICTVCRRENAALLSASAVKHGTRVKVHLKIDTGMNRLGIPADELAVVDFARYLETLPGIEPEGVFTHFATADDPSDPFRDQQLKRFLTAVDALEQAGFDWPVKHAANSAALISMPGSHLDMVRAGIAVYGLHPSGKVPLPEGARPALSLKADVSFVKDVPAGQGISYGLTYSTERESKIATLPAGYADGYTRLLSNRTEVLINGRRVPGVGTICMDQFMVDVTDAGSVRPGTTAVLIGRDGNELVTAEEVAERFGTINYEVVCMISKRVPRTYV